MSWKNVQYQNGKYRTSEGGGGGSSTFADLDDVNFTNLQNGQVPKYNSTTQEWENANESGGSVSADDVTYDNTTSGMSATNVQDALDEIAQDFQNGCDIIEQAVIAKGQTPASNSPQDIADAISQISGGGTDEVVEITSYTTNISPSTWYRRCILKVNHRIIFHVNFDGGSTSGGVWNDVITLNAEDVTDVTEFTYGADSYTGYFSSSGGAYNKIARYNPTTRAIQVWGGLSSRTNLFAGLRDVQVYNPEFLTPVIQNSSIISDIGNKIIQIGGFVIVELDCKMGSGAGASWYDKVIRLNTKYTLSGGYWAGSKMQTEGNPMSRDMGVNGSNGELNIFPQCNNTSVWMIRMILKVSGLQS